jgi:heme-degrading monooxygenase HmoA
MAYVLIEHLVEDYETFQKSYLDDAERRGRYGSLGGTMFRSVDDPDKVIIVLEWDDLEGAREWAASPERHEAMQRAGSIGTPRITVMEHVLYSET